MAKVKKRLLTEEAFEKYSGEIVKAVQGINNLTYMERAQLAASEANQSKLAAETKAGEASTSATNAAASAEAAKKSAEAAAKIVDVGVDPTLSVEGAAADSKTVGESVGKLNNVCFDKQNAIQLSKMVSGSRFNSDGVRINDSSTGIFVYYLSNQKILYVDCPNEWQFHKSKDIGNYTSNPYIVGGTHSAYTGFVDVPSEAVSIFIVVSSDELNTQPDRCFNSKTIGNVVDENTDSISLISDKVNLLEKSIQPTSYEKATGIELLSMLSGSQINAHGLRDLNDNYGVYIYDISYFETIYVDSKYRWQFQTTKSLPDTGSNPYIIGNINNAYTGFIDVPSEAKYIYITVDISEITNRVNRCFTAKKVNFSNSILTGIMEQPLDRVGLPPTFITMFRRIACIGDSLTRGQFNTIIPNSSGADIPDFSYPSNLEKMTGVEVLNFGIGGATVGRENGQTWNWNDIVSGITPNCPFTKEDFRNKPADVYIIALGTNDITKQGAFTGSISDINDSDYSLNADTSAGQYGKIIQRIKEIQPKAHVFCVTIPNSRNTGTQADNANELIRAIAGHFGCWVIDMAKYTISDTPDFKEYYMNDSHNNALGYNLRARQYISYIDWLIGHNLKAFKNVQFIGTDYDF